MTDELFDMPAPPGMRRVRPDHSFWDRFFTVAPLVLVGTLEPDGSADIAPKHQATPIGDAGLGVLYLQGRDTPGPFSEEDARLLEDLARLPGGAST